MIHKIEENQCEIVDLKMKTLNIKNTFILLKNVDIILLISHHTHNSI